MEEVLDTKECTKCGKIKTLDQFEFRTDTGKLRGQCIECRHNYSTEYRDKNDAEIRIRKQIYYEENKERIGLERKEKAKQKRLAKEAKKAAYREAHKEEIEALERQEKLQKEIEKAASKVKSKARLKAYNKEYKKNNKEKLRENNRKYERERRHADPAWKLRRDISRHINRMIAANGGSKAGQSILDYMPYSFDELKQHLESQFAPWMTWENHGAYDSKTWDDNNPSTWTWQIDHIIPHSTFHYTMMDCKEFQECWALFNLRPLSAKINIIDGAQRIRHAKKKA